MPANWKWVEQGDPKDYLDEKHADSGFWQGKGKFLNYRVLQHPGNECYFVLGRLPGEKEHMHTNIPYTVNFADLDDKVEEHWIATRSEW